ncbi:monooxygenase [Acrocarpospora pleiomorpha]|uniref:Monooxygenase n=1 Tax=Acrocarpospora pleiomorpha TaxID=90975 RepID=A0A5M3XLB4_9ACTN|nr:LLM class flavin-dependent oxidoreductase [Acrocarpospora pleiomorpha]GES22034.1 monooxygenase [Acrocarpospora pleiomorpha]
MKFTYFHLMPFDGLPEDFAQKHRSVWVDIDPRLMDVRRIHHLYNDYLDELEHAARTGFDAIGVNEHHSNAYGLMSSPNMMAASLARRTADTDAKILVMGDAVPLYNPPIRIAEELAMLDVISGGRLITGFPLGSSQDTNYAYGIKPATVRERYYEGFELILKAWQSQEVFSHNGRYTKLRYVNPWPKPLQQPHPPIWVPGSGSLETMDFAIQRGFPFFFLSYFGTEFSGSMLRRFWERAEAAGVDDNPYRVGMFQPILVADTDEEAERLYADHVKYFYRRCTHTYPGFAEAPGYKSVESLAAVLPPPGAKSTARPDSFRAARDYEWADFINLGIIIAGSPSTVREKLEHLSATNRIGNWIALMHIGDMPREKAMNNIELFATKVKPGLSGVFSQYEHHWWPKPIPGFEPARVAPVEVAAR